MTLKEFHRAIKSRNFKSTTYNNQQYEFKFTEVHVFRNGSHLCDYKLLEKNGDFYMTFDNYQINTIEPNFKNALFIIDNSEIIINPENLALNLDYKIRLQGL